MNVAKVAIISRKNIYPNLAKNQDNESTKSQTNSYSFGYLLDEPMYRKSGIFFPLLLAIENLKKSLQFSISNLKEISGENSPVNKILRE
jgi:hypothetical protein